MRKNKETILLAKIRVRIREAIKWYNKDKGMPELWSSKNYRKSIKYRQGIDGQYTYYTKSSKAIEDIAKKILDDLDKFKHKELLRALK